jgi:hypothetical protein
VVGVSVRDDDRVNGRDLIDRRCGAAAPDVEDAAAQQRIGQDPRPVELDQQCRVSDIGDAVFDPASLISACA